MRVVLVVLGAVGSLLLGLLGLIVLDAHIDPGAASRPVLSIALNTLVLVPLLAGVIPAMGVDLRRQDPVVSRTRRRFVWVAIGLETVPAVVVAVSASMAGAPVWLVALVVAGGFALLAAWLRVPPFLQASLDRSPDRSGPWWTIPDRRLRRQARTMVITGMIASAVIGGIAVTAALTRGHDIDVPTIVVVALMAGLFAAMLPVAFAPLVWNRAAHRALGDDPARIGRIGRAVSRGQQPVDAAEARDAARYAVFHAGALVASLRTAAAFLVTLVLLQIVAGLQSGQPALVLTTGGVVVLAILAGLAARRRLRRLHRYVAEHAELIDGPASATR